MFPLIGHSGTCLGMVSSYCNSQFIIRINLTTLQLLYVATLVKRWWLLNALLAMFFACHQNFPIVANGLMFWLDIIALVLYTAIEFTEWDI